MYGKGAGRGFSPGHNMKSLAPHDGPREKLDWYG